MADMPFAHILLSGRFAPLRAGHRYLLGVAQRLAPAVTVLAEADTGFGTWLRAGDQWVRQDGNRPPVPAGTVWLTADWSTARETAAEWGIPLWPLDRHSQLELPWSESPFASSGGDATRQVVLFGPECVGKTTLARQLAAARGGLWCAEQVRTFFDFSECRITQDEAATVGQVQAAMIGSLRALGSGWLFCDTDPLVSRMWYEHYFGPAPERLVAAASSAAPALTLLLEDDLAFQADPQRRYPDRREFGTEHAEAWLQRAGRAYCRIADSGEARLQAALAALEALQRSA